MGNVRVRGHDYRGKGYYFITFGTLGRKRWLSRIVDGRIVLEVGEARVRLVIDGENLVVDCLVMPRLVDGFKIILGMDLIRRIDGVTVGTAGVEFH